MAEIQRELVKKSFGSHAGQYDSLARVQKRVTDRFVELYGDRLPASGSLLDIGAGTGRLLEALQRKLPQTGLIGIDLAFGMTRQARSRLENSQRVGFVCSDAERLPFCGNCFDAVVSTSTYQWISPLDAAFAEVFRVLKPNGRFCFALFGEKTLHELRDSYRQAAKVTGIGTSDRTHDFASGVQIREAMVSAGFSDCAVLEEMEMEIHADVPALLRSLKGIGAGSAARRSGGLSGRKTMQEMMKIYTNGYSNNGGVQASYHVLYCTGEKR